MPDNTSDVFNRMLGYLPPSFNVDPIQKRAFTVAHPTKTVKITIDGFFFRIWVGDSFVPQADIDLRSLTIQQLADTLDEIDLGLVIEVTAYGSKSALRLLDCTNDTTAQMWVYTNPVWAILKGWALELMDAEKALKEAIRQMSIVGANSYVQDYWGSFADILRNSEELDSVYGQRVLAEIKEPKSNNRALERIIKKVMNLDTEVIDLGEANVTGVMYMNDSDTPMHDRTFCLWDFDSPSFYLPCCFGVVLQGITVEELTSAELSQLQKLVYKYKAAGTCPYLIWYGEGQIMYMNDPDTPINDVYYPLAGWYTTTGGYSILAL